MLGFLSNEGIANYRTTSFTFTEINPVLIIIGIVYNVSECSLGDQQSRKLLGPLSVVKGLLCFCRYASEFASFIIVVSVFGRISERILTLLLCICCKIKKHTDIFIRWVPNRHFRTKFGIVDARDTILDISQQTLELKTSIIAG